jgi:uncharacterized protein YndB with AHSA1/START domain
MSQAAGTKQQRSTEALDLVITRVIDAPRERVFQAWTEPGQLVQWWGPRGMTTPVCEMDLRPGGIFRTVMRAPDGTEYPNTGVFLEVRAPEQLVFSDAYEPGWKPAPEPFMTAVIRFEKEGRGTKIVARALHRSLAAREKHEKMGFHTGWGEMLDRLAEAVSSVGR